MNGSSTESKQRLPAVVRRSAVEREERGCTVGDAFAELRAICEEESYGLQFPEREDRPNPFAEGLALDRRTRGRNLLDQYESDR